MSKFGELNSYVGVSHEFFFHVRSPRGFFKRFESKADVFLRALCIVTAPLIYIGAFPLQVIRVCVNGLKALIAFITSNRWDLAHAKRDSKFAMINFCIYPIATVLSPFVNFVDFVGSVVTTAIPENKEPKRAMR